MSCTNCHKEIDADADFCNYCGALVSCDKRLKADVDTYKKMPSKPRLSIGRSSGNDIVLDFPQISFEHAWLIKNKEGWLLKDRNSTNHTYVNDRSQPISQETISDDDTIYFGSYKTSARRLLRIKKETTLGRTDPHGISITSRETIFGRDPASTIHLDYPQISWRHAKLTRKDSDFILEDNMGSTNGTYVNGGEISTCKVTPADTIAFGSFIFKLTEDHKIIKRDYRGDIRLDAENISIIVKDNKTGDDKTLLENVSLTIYPSEFVGLMGPSGAGKTTLMLALNGYSPPNKGFSRINGQSLYEQYDSFRGSIGYVPQDDILHPELTVNEALYYTAKLRLPDDTTDKEISTLIDRILTQLGLLNPAKNIDVRNVMIGSPGNKGISGGQRKRVNLAMELLTEPSLLFLDEPTSGLSSEDTLVVMDVLRKLADEGKTIILTIHQPSLEAYRKMDNVIILSSGKLMYYGPAYPDSINFFNPKKFSEIVESKSISSREVNCKCPHCGYSWYDVTNNADNVLRGLANRKENEWETEYSESNYHQTYIKERKNTELSDSDTDKKVQKLSHPFNFRQWWSLTKRYFTVKMKDLTNTTILMAQAPIIAVIIAIVFHGNENLQINPPIPLFLLVLSGLWFGASNSAREIVAERVIYLRERMVNLKIPSYLFSKYAVLSLLCLIQCMVMVGIVHPALDFNGGFFQMVGVTFMSSLAGLSIGLFISSIMKTQQAAIAIVPIVLLPMVMLGGGMLRVKEMNKPALVLSYAMPARWAYEQILHVEDNGAKVKKNNTAPNSGQDLNAKPAINYTDSLYGDYKIKDEGIFVAMAVFIVGFLGLTMGALKQKDMV